MVFEFKAGLLLSISSPQRSPQRSHILDLPIEVFALVLKLLASRDLLRCATVCSRWKDLALDVKWKEHLVDWYDLLRVLGSIEPCDDDESEYRWVTKHFNIEDGVASAGWRRLNELRKKITRLQIETHLAQDDFDYLLKIHRAAEYPRHRDPFCPKLRELEVIFDEPQPYMYDFLVGGSLQQFKLNLPLSDTEGYAGLCQVAIQSIALGSPLVERISVLRSDSPFINYGKFSRLRILNHGGDFSVKSWIQLCAGCPLLEDVNIWWIQDELDDEDAVVTGPQAQALPVLRVLRIGTIENAEFVYYIIQSTNMPQLRELDVDLRELRSEDAEELLSLVRKRSPWLTTLNVNYRSLELGRFALFSQLRDLELYGMLGSWTTEDLDRIFESLPNLTRLLIASSGDDDVDRTKPAFTPAILESIATRCRLYQLEIPLNALEIPWASEPPSPTAKFDGLGVLALDPLHIERNAMGPFAKYLAQLCPTVNRFETLPLHAHVAWSEIESPWELTEEERTNMMVMRNLFFEAQKECEASGSAAEES
ncbi:hypothetical protein FRC01_007540 [Tulasnella sp. 417]|nr:hypothetical protein FRC01_007540 [Tulasnella sp. 417]